jgi:hypothetical protein
VKRREFIAALGAAAARPMMVRAPQPAKSNIPIYPDNLINDQCLGMNANTILEAST